jgi:chemotaxis signal transduction protein
MESEPDNPVRCLIIPAENINVVVPSAAVAEVVPLNISNTDNNDSTMGTMEWRGVTVPVFSFEKLLTGQQPQYGRRSKACIFYPWKGADSERFFAIVSMQDPRPRLLSDEDIQLGEDNEADSSYVQASFRYEDESAVIPDLLAISNAA